MGEEGERAGRVEKGGKGEAYKAMREQTLSLSQLQQIVKESER